MSTFLVCVTVFVLDLSSPAQILIPLLCALPGATVGSYLEKRLRMLQGKNHTFLVNWAARPQPEGFPARLIWISMGRKIAWESGVFLGLILLVTYFTIYVGPPLANIPAVANLQWAHLWTLAMIGAVFSLRIRRAYYVLIVGMLLWTLFLAVFL